MQKLARLWWRLARCMHSPIDRKWFSSGSHRVRPCLSVSIPLHLCLMVLLTAMTVRLSHMLDVLQLTTLSSFLDDDWPVHPRDDVTTGHRAGHGWADRSPLWLHRGRPGHTARAPLLTHRSSSNCNDNHAPDRRPTSPSPYPCPGGPASHLRRSATLRVNASISRATVETRLPSTQFVASREFSREQYSNTCCSQPSTQNDAYSLTDCSIWCYVHRLFVDSVANFNRKKSMNRCFVSWAIDYKEINGDFYLQSISHYNL